MSIEAITLWIQGAKMKKLVLTASALLLSLSSAAFAAGTSAPSQSAAQPAVKSEAKEVTPATASATPAQLKHRKAHKTMGSAKSNVNGKNKI